MVEGQRASSAEETRQLLADAGAAVAVPVTRLLARRVYQSDYRLDAGYHSADVQRASGLLDALNVEVRPLHEMVKDIFRPGIFKRVYAMGEQEGMRFLVPSAMLHFRPSSEKWLLRSLVEQYDLAGRQGCLLLTRSGSVGRSVVVGKYLAQFAMSDDAIRVEPGADMPVGYLHAFLQTWIGQTLLIRDQYGVTVKHLEPHHISDIPIPVLQQETQQHFHGLISKVCQLRDETNELLDNADAQMYRDLELPPFADTSIDYLPRAPKDADSFLEVARVVLRAFLVRSKELASRLDASFHIPLAKSAIGVLVGECPYPLRRLGDIAADIFVAPRFKRTYVEPQYGIPFMQGSHVPQQRYTDLKYLSRKTERLETWIVKRGQVLVTCSGTIGRIGMVTSRTDGWAASQHILRITCNAEQAHPGYIAAVLMSPYGQYQLLSKIYGGVVDELTADDAANVMLPDAPWVIQESIGRKVMEAFEKRDTAWNLEDGAIKALERLLEGEES